MTGSLTVLWHKHRALILNCTVVALAAAALYRLGFAFARLVFNYQSWANIDLRNFYRLVGTWFAGEPLVGSVYPPATYGMLWPFLGWVDLTGARWLWALTSAVALVWLSIIVRRESLATTQAERWIWTLLPLAAYASAATIGNGQLALHVMAPLLAGILILHRRAAAWHTDILAAAMIIFALVKPPMSAPLFWIVMFACGRLRPAALVVGGYGALTAVATWLRMRASGAPDVLQRSIESGVEGTVIGSAELGGGYANIHDWLTALGLERFNAVASLLLLGLLGIWIFRQRHRDVWILMGVAALLARFWAYHRLYDDLLILIPMITLARLLREPGSRGLAGARYVLGLLWVSMLIPAGLLIAPFPAGLVGSVGQTVIWAIALAYLLRIAARR